MIKSFPPYMFMLQEEENAFQSYEDNPIATITDDMDGFEARFGQRICKW